MHLIGKHIYLRPVKRDDALSIFLYAGDEKTTTYMLWGPNTYSDTLRYVEATLELDQKVIKTIYRFAIILKHSDDLIGMIDLTLKNTHVGELGYILNQAYWGRGYTTEAARIMIKYGFQTLGLTKIIATCDKRNIASYKVMEKLGMHFVGTYTRFNPKTEGELEGLLYEYDKNNH